MMVTPLRVLLVDDGEADAELVLDELRRSGYSPEWRRAHCAHTLRTALTEPWDLLLCDSRSAGSSRREAIAILRAARLETPVLVVASERDAAGTGAAVHSTPAYMQSSLSELGPAVAHVLQDAQ